MIKEHIKLFRQVVLLLDIGVIVISFFAGFLLRTHIDSFGDLARYLVYLPLMVGIWLVFLNHFQMYESVRTKTMQYIIATVAKTLFLSLVSFACITYFFKMLPVSRLFILLTFMIAAVLIALEKAVLLLVFHHVRRKGYNYRSVLVVGSGPRAQRFIDMVREHREWGMHIVGLIDRDASLVGEEIKGITVLGTLDTIINVIHSHIVDEVFLVVPRSWLYHIENVINALEVEGIRVSLATDYFDVRVSRAVQTDLHGWPLMTFGSTPDDIWPLVFKRLLDVLGAVVALVLSAPLFAGIAIAVRATSPGPIFFRQKRAGMNGRVFTLYKFRTMGVDAEEKLDDLRQHNEMEGPVFKMADDPRVTGIGKLLRRTSLDELPQLWNVLRGEMSLVGPRPPIPAEVAHYQPWQRRRLSMRPGITCFWQIRGRNRITDFDTWMKYDLEYIDKWSLWLDLKILAATIPVVLFGIGAK